MRVKIGELTAIRTGKLDANASSLDGKYPFFTCSKEPLKIAEYSYDCECVLVAGNGDLNVKYYNGKFDAYQRTYIIEDNSSGRLYMPYLYFFMLRYIEELRKQSIGGVIKYIKLSNLTEAEIELPAIEEQMRIVQILKSAQSVVEKGERKKEYLNALIKARFVEMFGDLKNTIRLGDCCKVHARIGWQALTRDEHMKTGEYMLVTGTDFIDGKINYNTCVYVTRERYEMDPHIILRENDILITKDGSIGKVAIIHNLSKPATLNSGVFVVRPKDIFNKEYISGVFRGPLFEKFIELSKTGATIKHLNQKHLVEFRIPLPTLEKQEVFARFSNQINKSKVEVQRALDEAQLLFDSLMQKYFG